MILKNLSGALILDKPAGVATHTPDGGRTLGFVEMASTLLDTPLWAVHRLDNTTSGCLLVTTSGEGVDEWTQKLAQGKKKYVFISRAESQDTLFSFTGRIEKTGSHRFGLVAGEKNSQTTFIKIGKNSLGFIYEAEISTGKTHQIRIHAEACGVPILGDIDHGGEKFFRIMLHAKELELSGEKVISPLPQIYNLDRNETHYEDLGKFLVSFDRRRFLMRHEGDTYAFRLVHREWATLKGPRLCIEKLGSVLQVLTYFGRDPDEDFLKNLCALVDCTHYFVRQMFDRGATASGTIENIKTVSSELPLQWQIKEAGIIYDLRYNQGLSSGLFLDQRSNRQRVKQIARGKKVANFFSYTCGFSLSAALGGATEVVSIDTSANNLNWGKENFKLNKLDPDKYEFFTADALFFLQACLKRGRAFDLIIIDPPTFSRSKHGVFTLKENLNELLSLALRSLTPQGELLITLNDENIDAETLAKKIEDVAGQLHFSPMKVKRASVPWDFEFPLERDTVMKGFWISRI